MSYPHSEDGARAYPLSEDAPRFDTLADVPGLRIDKPHPRAPGYAVYHNATGLPVVLCRTGQAAEAALQRLRGPDWCAITTRQPGAPQGLYARAVAYACEVEGVTRG